METIRIIGVRMDLGAGRRGVDMGPSAMRKAGIRQRLRDLGYEVVDEGNLHVDEPEAIEILDPKLKYLPEITAVMEDLAKRVTRSLSSSEIPLVLGGDHSIAIGTIAGLAAYYRQAGKKIGMIWLDAHGDVNTPETSPSGNIHGMPQAIAFGRGADELTTIGGFAPGESKLDPACCCIIGARSIDRTEKKILAEIGLHVFTMEQIDRRGIYDVCQEAIEHLDARHRRRTRELRRGRDGPERRPRCRNPGEGWPDLSRDSYGHGAHRRDGPDGLDGGRRGEPHPGYSQLDRRSCRGDGGLGLRKENSVAGPAG